MEKSLLRLSWRRLGIPSDIASLLISYDIGGNTIVGTPLARDTLRRRGTGAFSILPTPPNLWCFEAIVGTGQGDIPSPCNWNAFFDILLVALATSTHQSFSTRGPDHLLRPTQDTAYADDLLSVSATGPGLQRKADIVSAFCIVFGMEIATPKLRAVQIHWGHEDRRGQPTPHLTIRNRHWSNTSQVPLRQWNDVDAKPTKYLGILFDYINSNATHLSLTTSTIQQDFSTLLRRTGLPLLKIEVAIAGVLSKARYAAVFSPWNLPTLHKIDRVFATYFRQILGLHQGFPTALLYTPASFAGLGLPRFSDVVATSKLSMLHQALHGDPHTSHAMTGLLHRLARNAGAPLRPNIASSLLPDSIGPSPTWATCLSEWLAQGSLHLTIGGNPSSHTLDESLSSYFARHDSPLPPQVLTSYYASSLHTVDDKLIPTSQGPAWLQIPSDPTLLLDFSLPLIPPPTHLQLSLSLRPFQCWLLRSQQRVVEILGRSVSNPSSISVRYWLPAHPSHRPISRTPPFRQGSSLHLDPATFSRGASSDTSLLDDTLWSDIAIDSTRIILSGDIPCASRSGVRRQILAMVPFPRPPLPLSSPLASVPIHPLPGSLRHLPQAYSHLSGMRIFTDGSYSRTTTGLAGLYSTTPTCLAFASIVFQPPDDRLLGPRTLSIRITHGETIRHCNAYIMESLALALACKIRESVRRSHPDALLPIYTDCKSARHHALQPPSHPWTSTAYFLYSILWKLKPTAQDLHWTPGHPERRTKDFSQWSDLECGNQIADIMAAPSGPPTLGTLYTLTASEVLQFLQLDASWFIADGSLPLLTSPLKVIQQANHAAYLLQRDTARQLRGRPLQWQNFCLSRTGLWHNAVKAPLPTSSSPGKTFVRLVYSRR